MAGRSIRMRACVERNRHGWSGVMASQNVKLEWVLRRSERLD